MEGTSQLTTKMVPTEVEEIVLTMSRDEALFLQRLLGHHTCGTHRTPLMMYNELNKALGISVGATKPLKISKMINNTLSIHPDE